MATVLITVSPLRSAYAMWFEASGKATIHDGNKDLAREMATQDAIKQALLFSGASVTSVQQMANGLLKDDRFEITANGEVNNIELIDETYHDNYVSVRIRADIFPKNNQCKAADYQKNIVTTWFPIKHKDQATPNNLYDLGKAMSDQFRHQFAQYGRNSHINRIHPGYLEVERASTTANVIQLAREYNSQYVLFAEIEDISLDDKETNSWSWLATQKRNLAIRFQLMDGTTGAYVTGNQYQIQPVWEFDKFKKLDVDSQTFWKSAFGEQTRKLLQNMVFEIDDLIACQPAYARVLQVQRNQLLINMGQNQGVEKDDKLTLFQLQQYYSGMGRPQYRYSLSPYKLRVAEVYSDSALVIPMDDEILSNIQPNDFVTRQ